ncbi:MAG: hypothetical protein GF416_02650 [Candidatus Altiarchaeales archaeon]|nr:hypothetical protein [Candidatus Altiarchaeales archaeon]MBD3416019.1 hypothetical protein [Candidatus Altiarchaeales archaeon]
MAVETYYNPPPRRGREEPDEAFLGRVVDWIQNTEVHGSREEKSLPRVTRQDVPRILAKTKELGLSVDDADEAIRCCDGVQSKVEYELRTMKAQRDMAERARKARDLPRLR